MPVLEGQKSTLGVPSGTWSIDPPHSSVGFAVDYIVGRFRGSFSTVSGALDVRDDGTLSLCGRTLVESVQVDMPALKASLLGPEFFDAERTPEVEFHSTRFDIAGSEVTVTGDLAIRGVTRPVVLRGRLDGPVTDGFGRTFLNLSLETMIDRSDFGLTWNSQMPNGKQALANEVSLSADLYLQKA